MSAARPLWVRWHKPTTAGRPWTRWHAVVGLSARRTLCGQRLYDGAESRPKVRSGERCGLCLGVLAREGA